ncbi:hypothetical protein KKC62_02385 [Patescibacteria group bacterium]|nr:hypothetical protein [Patescibacteria group bacterium]MBU1953028.1 hypothetical protein [Patescibacteria group bacterium]
MKIINYLKTHAIELAFVVALVVFACSMMDKNYYIGGDVMFPLNPLNNVNKSFMWDAGSESQNSSHFFWYLFYFILGSIGVPSFIAHKILILTLIILGFVFSYLLFKELFTNAVANVGKGALAAATFYVLNPIYYLVVDAYLPLYGFPICSFLLIKYLKSKKLIYAVFFALCVNFFFFIDLPQLKQLIIFSISTMFLLAIYKHLYPTKIRNLILDLSKAFIITVGLNLWVIIPFTYSIFWGAVGGFSSNLSSYGGSADLHTASIFYIIRFFNSAIINIYPGIHDYLTSWYFVIWTFFLQALLLSGFYFFNRDNKKRKVFLLLLSAMLVLVFIAKGPNPPFGDLYRLIIVNIPQARMFRTTAYVAIGAAMFYSLALALIATKISEYKKGNSLLNILIVIHLVIFFPIYFGHKFFNYSSSNFERKGYKLPNEYWSMGKSLDSIKTDSKVMFLPLSNGYISKKWGYSGADLLTWISKKELVARQDEYGLSIEDKSGIQNGAGLYNSFIFNNTSHILLQKDSMSVPTFDTTNSFTQLVDNRYFTLYKVPLEKYLPKLYVPNKVLYVQSSLADIHNVVDFENYDMRSQVYYLDPNERIKHEIPSNVQNTASDFFVIPQQQISQLSASTMFWNKGWAWPEANTSPVSIKYLAVKLIELKDIYIKSEVLDKVDVYVWLSAKRSAELLKYDLDPSHKDSIINSYVEELGAIKKMLSSIPETEYTPAFWGIVRKTFVYIGKSKDAVLSSSVSPQQRAKVLQSYDKLKDWITVVGNPDCAEYCYKFTMPKSGEYDVYLDTTGILNSVNTESLDIVMAAHDTTLTKLISSENKKDDWVNLGRVKLNTDQEYKYGFSLPTFKNLVDSKKWESVSSNNLNGLDLRSQSIVSTLFTPEKKGASYDRPITVNPLKEWESSKEYKIKFNYSVTNGNLGVAVIEEVPDYAKASNTGSFSTDLYPFSYRNIYSKEFNGKSDKEDVNIEGDATCSYIEEGSCYRTFEQVVKASKDTKNAFIAFYSNAYKDNASVSKIRNISVTQYIRPKIILREKVPLVVTPEEDIPSIDYIRVNQTKYVVKVVGAQKPYDLVFGENFNSNWKIYFVPNVGYTGLNSRQASYFGGKVNEGTHSDLFLYKNMFDTWNLSSIADKSHFMVNGYANVWKIDPKDTNNLNNYYLIIEYTPQRILYFGIILSVIFTFVLTVFVVVGRLRRGLK